MMTIADNAFIGETRMSCDTSLGIWFSPTHAIKDTTISQYLPLLIGEE